MIKNEKISIIISYRNVTHYLKLGYPAVINSELEITTTDLPTVSHQKIDVICEICKIEKNLMYCKYIENINRHGFYSCKKCSRQKAVMTSRKIYGVDNYMMLDEAKNRVTESNIKKYGVKTTLLHQKTKEKISKTLLKRYGTDKFYEIKEKSLKNKFIFLEMESKENFISDPKDNYSNIFEESYRLYRNEVRRLTNKSAILLLENWDGYDYYDKEFIRDNFSLPHNDVGYPTVDHKISIYYGYKNNISPEKISSIENLCITKRWINSKKRENVI